MEELRHEAMYQRTYDPEWKRHHKHPPALCRRGSPQNLIKLGICTGREYSRSQIQVKLAKPRNRYWAALNYPNLVRARAAKKEHARRRRLLGVTGPVWSGPNVDHSVDHLLEVMAPVPVNVPRHSGL
jgi:hypothetical protein